MSQRTVNVDVAVDIDLDDFDDDEIIDEMHLRGYECIKSQTRSGLDRADFEYLIELVDRSEETWYTRRVRDKLLTAKFI